MDDGTTVAETLSFSYDASGIPMSVVYNGTAYFYTVNLQGDVVAIVDATGTAVVSYAYDAWGNILSVTGTMADTLGESNPLRYRGYVYDPETGLYYVSSRYYDPEIGWWINADGVLSEVGREVFGYNLFAYGVFLSSASRPLKDCCVQDALRTNVFRKKTFTLKTTVLSFCKERLSVMRKHFCANSTNICQRGV